MHMIWQRYSVAAGTAGGVAAVFCGHFPPLFFAVLTGAVFAALFVTAFFGSVSFATAGSAFAAAAAALFFAAAFLAVHRVFKAATTLRRKDLL